MSGHDAFSGHQETLAFIFQKRNCNGPKLSPNHKELERNSIQNGMMIKRANRIHVIYVPAGSKIEYRQALKKQDKVETIPIMAARQGSSGTAPRGVMRHKKRFSHYLVHFSTCGGAIS